MFVDGAAEEPIDVLNSSSTHCTSNVASPPIGMLPTHEVFAPHMSMYIPLGGSGTGTCRVVVFLWISSTKKTLRPGVQSSLWICQSVHCRPFGMLTFTVAPGMGVQSGEPVDAGWFE